MKTLLIPTDFKLQSLNAIPRLVKLQYPEKINIVMVHMLAITDAMGELELLSRRSAEYQHISDQFYKECTRLKRTYVDQIENIGITFFYGHTMAAFRNFLDAQQVDTIIQLDGYDHDMLTEKSIDPNLLIHRSGKEILLVSANAIPVAPTPVKVKTIELEEEIV